MKKTTVTLIVLLSLLSPVRWVVDYLVGVSKFVVSTSVSAIQTTGDVALSAVDQVNPL